MSLMTITVSNEQVNASWLIINLAPLCESRPMIFYFYTLVIWLMHIHLDNIETVAAYKLSGLAVSFIECVS